LYTIKPMKKIVKNEQIFQEIVHLVRKCYPAVIAIYCFGSFRTPYETKESDIDLAILPVIKTEVFERYQLIQEIARFCKKDVDLIDLLSAKTPIQFQAIQQGKRIYCANRTEASFFESRVFSDYVRLQELRKDILTDIQQRGTIL